MDTRAKMPVIEKMGDWKNRPCQERGVRERGVENVGAVACAVQVSGVGPKGAETCKGDVHGAICGLSEMIEHLEPLLISSIKEGSAQIE